MSFCSEAISCSVRWKFALDTKGLFNNGIKLAVPGSALGPGHQVFSYQTNLGRILKGLASCKAKRWFKIGAG